MAKDYAVSFYKSKAWERCRTGYIASVFGLCERCGRSGSIVHHRTYITPQNINDIKITLSWDNLELLCDDCHNKEHHSSLVSGLRDGFMFDAGGNVVPTPPSK